MQLTERQCWKVIRDLVVEKNKEYSTFLLKIFDANQNKQLQGYTREAFLSKFDFYSMDKFYDYAQARNNGKQPNPRWLENLSCEDLVLFLDFRCKILQEVYDKYKKNNDISKAEIKDIIYLTKISRLAKYNAITLACGSKPARVEGEIKNSELPYTQSQLKQMALTQVVSKMASKLLVKMDTTVDVVQQIVDKLQTSNVDLNGVHTGCAFNSSKVSITRPLKLAKNEIDDRIEFIGYDENKRHIFISNGIKIDFFGKPVGNVKIVYDEDMQPIQPDEVEHRFVGFDIQGSPVYEYGDDFYTSTGRKLAEDEQIFGESEFEPMGY